MTNDPDVGFKPSGTSLEIAEKLWEAARVEGRAPDTNEIAEALDVARASEHREAGRAAVRAIISAQLEVISQCIELVRKFNKVEIIIPGKGPRHKIGTAIKLMEAEQARLKGIESYVPPDRHPVIEAPAGVLPKGTLGGIKG